ncbi:MAG: hypothetical protein JWP87_6082 [Labilithrix sp.]|nr:hypothetical protein [Labilithrix sp.]
MRSSKQRYTWPLCLVLGVAGAGGAGCSAKDSNDARSGGDEPSADAGLASTLLNAKDVPIDGVTKEMARSFAVGDGRFDLPFREADGLGPLYIRAACSACHDGGGRGPGLVQKMTLVDADGTTPSADQSLLAFGHTLRPLLTAGATTPIAPPPGARVKVTTRLGPPVLGRGYIEAVADSEIERVAAEQQARTDGIHGRINRVTFTSEANTDKSFHAHAKGETNLIGRFGVKGRIATIDDFTADAFQGDMGMTSPMRPVELPNPDGLQDDKRPGVDVPLEYVNDISLYLRLIAIPKRADLDEVGRAAFDTALCSTCHVPSMKTRADYPIALLAGIDAPIYTDLLLHDMGPALADGIADGNAGPADWKTAPLIGLRFEKTFLHDGRAHTIEDAILLHDGEARVSLDRFRALSPADGSALVRFVNAL